MQFRTLRSAFAKRNREGAKHNKGYLRRLERKGPRKGAQAAEEGRTVTEQRGGWRFAIQGKPRKRKSESSDSPRWASLGRGIFPENFESKNRIKRRARRGWGEGDEMKKKAFVQDHFDASKIKVGEKKKSIGLNDRDRIRRRPNLKQSRRGLQHL